MKTSERHPILLPPRLRCNDLVAIVAPSGAVKHSDRLARGIAAIRELGFRTVVSSAVNSHDMRSAADRAEEFNRVLRDPEVRGVFTAIGGYRSNTLLDLIDWPALRSDPKVLVGYSDITALLVAAVEVAGVVAFHGPTVLPEFAEFPTVLDYTATAFRRATTSDEPLGMVEPAELWTEEFLAWGEADNRAREMRMANTWDWFGSGVAIGRLIGGNLETLCALAGTRYFPDVHGAVVLLESAGDSLEMIDRDLTHLAMLGVFDQMAGLLFGHSFRGSEGFQKRLDEHLRARFEAYDVPGVLGVHIGHTDPMPTLPLGVRVRLDADFHELEVLDAAVR